MKFDAFVGGAYELSSRQAESQSTINLLPEQDQSGQGKNAFILRGTPGRTLFGTIDDSPVNGLFAGENRLFAVAGAGLYEVFSDGTSTLLGAVTRATNPAQMVLNGNQLFVTSGGDGFVATGTTVVPVVPGATNTFIDRYGIVSRPNTSEFAISAIDDFLTWDPLDFDVKSGYPDHLSAVFADKKLLWLFGFDTTEIWQDTGAANFPFQLIPNALIENGAAPWSIAKVGESLMWLVIGKNGAGWVAQAFGQTPKRVSNHAIETAIQGYTRAGTTTIDAVAYSYQENGHTFYVLTFPTADATWAYDLTTSLWHQRGVWTSADGRFHRDRVQCHAYAFGKHIVGDSATGQLYEQSAGIFNDNGAVIRRLRRAPHLSNENDRVRYFRMELDMQKGTAAPSAGAPEMILRYSDDGGETWSNEKVTTAGASGDFSRQAIWRQLGSGRDRVFEVTSTAEIDHTWINAYLRV